MLIVYKQSTIITQLMSTVVRHTFSLSSASWRYSALRNVLLSIYHCQFVIVKSSGARQH